MIVTLRSMRWWDVDEVMTLERVLFTEDAWSAAMFWSELAEWDTRCYLVADEEARIVGYAGVCLYVPEQAYVQTIAVTPDRQGRGIGRMLLAEIVAESDRQGCAQLDLEVRADNATAIRLYERHGFHRVGVRRGYYQPSGADALVMRRERGS